MVMKEITCITRINNKCSHVEGWAIGHSINNNRMFIDTIVYEGEWKGYKNRVYVQAEWFGHEYSCVCV